MDSNASLRRIPSVDQLLKSASAGAAIERFGRPAVTEALRSAVADLRNDVREGRNVPAPENIMAAALARLRCG